MAAGDTYVSPTLASYLLRAEKSASEYQLTKRERACWHFWRPGRGSRHRGELFIATTTVHSHLERIRDKTGARRRAELTTLAHRLGIGPSESDNRR